MCTVAPKSALALVRSAEGAPLSRYRLLFVVETVPGAGAAGTFVFRWPNSLKFS
jgi:hypothetical protein